MIKEHYYSQFTFKPAINKISQQLGEKRTVEDMTKDTRKQVCLGLTYGWGLTYWAGVDLRS